MDSSYVESGAFNCISDMDIGCNGRRVKIRQYTLKENPDQRPSDHMVYSVVAAWVECGYPCDEVFHLGDFYRVTSLRQDGTLPSDEELRLIKDIMKAAA